MWKILWVALMLAGIAGPVSADVLTDQQLVKPEEFSQKESDYYQKLTDPEAGKNFIITRSYVRLCQKVIDHTLAAKELPDKPLVFSARYLLPGEATIINTAISDSIKAEFMTVAPKR